MPQLAYDKLPILWGGTGATTVAGAMDNLYVYTPQRNIVRNGTGQIHQRGSSIASPTNGTYTLDGWLALYSSTAAVTVSHDTTVVPASTDDGYKYRIRGSIKVDCTTADTSVAASDYFLLAQYIEGFFWNQIVFTGGKLSFWIRSPKAGEHYVTIRNRNTYDRTLCFTYTVNAADTWQFVELTIPAAPTGSTFDNGNGVSAEIIFPLLNGTNHLTSAGAGEWETSNTGHGPTGSTLNLLDNTANNMYITDVQIVPGGTAGDNNLPPTNFHDDMMFCQRYYQTIRGLAAVANQVWSGGAYSANALLVNIPMRTPPSLSYTLGAGTGGTFGLLYNFNEGPYTIYQEAANSVGTTVDHVLNAELS